MTTTTDTSPTCSPDWTLSICGPNEIRITDLCSGEVRQKYVALTSESDEAYWTYEELLDIGALLHDAPEFKTQQFIEHKHLILHLGSVLVERPPRDKLVPAMLFLMHAWYNTCLQDRQCIPPPSRANLKDKQQRKVYAAIDELKFALQQAKYTNAVDKSTRVPAVPLDEPTDAKLIADMDAARAEREK